jgi:beta-glucanase (GH16 family)
MRIRTPYRRKSVVAALALVTIGLGALAVAQPTPRASAASTTIFSDDFSGDLSQWTNQTGRRNVGGVGDPTNWGTGEMQTYSARMRHTNVTGGNLVLTPELTKTGWYSGRIQSRSSFRVAVGEKVTVESRLAIPRGGAGFWPAFWLLSDGTWPLDGEIDIMENVNQATEYFSTLHCGIVPGGPCNESEGKDKRTPCGNCQGFNTYGVIIDRGTNPSLTWTFNGTPVHTVTTADFPGGQDAFTATMDSDYRIIFNVAIGGAFPIFYDPQYESKMDATIGLKSPMLVDSVTVTKN